MQGPVAASDLLGDEGLQKLLVLRQAFQLLVSYCAVQQRHLVTASGCQHHKPAYFLQDLQHSSDVFCMCCIVVYLSAPVFLVSNVDRTES